jgi:hypothetical protein
LVPPESPKIEAAASFLTRAAAFGALG